ncbi:hypothetical protein FXO38_33507 [Capsicum annuum]|nr:hypothetical protein FXO38_33507 [Capsicum annuum]KAF3629449.1 hypothetical protein FXO37_28932 [Capsicum annuum]
MPGSKSETLSSLFRSASKLSKQWKSASPKNSAEDIALKNYVSSKPLSEIAAETLKFNSHDRGMGNKGGDDNVRNRKLINNVKLQENHQHCCQENYHRFSVGKTAFLMVRPFPHSGSLVPWAALSRQSHDFGINFILV